MILFLDTNVVIYAVENPLVLGSKALARILAARSAGDTFMISDLVRMEALVGPLKRGNALLEQRFRQFWAVSDLVVVPIASSVCDRAAEIRATHNIKAMDALQLAAAVEHGADTFLTADARLSAFPDIPVEVLK